ncbi:MAG: lipopolysaccharide assembly protein LapA domain-containing protein [Haliea sp.]|jgi:lipopolysaccharide assembly protein A
MNVVRKVVYLLVVLAMLALGVLFALQNSQPVGLDMLVHEFAPRSLALWLLAAFALGGVLGMLVSSVITLRLRAGLSLAQRKLDKCKLELDRLRVAGIKDGE